MLDDAGKPTMPAEGANSCKYTVGTLRYTTAGLVVVGGWMIWGNVCFSLMQSVFSTLMTIQLRDIQASPGAMGLLIGTIPAALTFVLVPIISFKSDRYRSRWGRRKPFIIWTAPFLVLALGSLGYVRDIHQFMNDHADWLAGHHLAPITASLGVIGVLVVLFIFFDDFVNSVAWYLITDVIPAKVMGRYNAIGLLVTAGANMLWSRFVIPHYTPEDARYVYWGAALLYFVGYGLMCVFVKEGDYPPPPETEQRASRFGGLTRYFRECFSHPMYLALFGFTAVLAVSNACNTWRILFVRETVGLSMAQYGMVLFYCAPLSMALALPVGYLVDRFTPVRMLMVATALLVPMTLANFWVHDYRSMLILSLVSLPANAAWDAAMQPMLVQLLPRAQYGQFCSANSMVRSLIRIGAPMVGAAYITFMHQDWVRIFYWQGFWLLGSLGVLFLLYAQYRKNGGPYHYVAPVPTV